MLDGFRTCKDGAPHSFGRTGMDGHGYTRALCCLNREFHLFERKGGMGTRVRSPAVIAVELDPVRTASDLISHDLNQTIDSIRFFSTIEGCAIQAQSLSGH